MTKAAHTQYSTIRGLCSLAVLCILGATLSGCTGDSDTFFSEGNCNNFVMHVSSIMSSNPSASKPISRSGNKKELLERCRENAFSRMKIECSLNATTIDGVHECLYTDFSSINTGKSVRGAL